VQHWSGLYHMHWHAKTQRRLTPPDTWCSGTISECTTADETHRFRLLPIKQLVEVNPACCWCHVEGDATTGACRLTVVVKMLTQWPRSARTDGKGSNCEGGWTSRREWSWLQEDT
jgi:hypothetical protein